MPLQPQPVERRAEGTADIRPAARLGLAGGHLAPQYADLFLEPDIPAAPDDADEV
ncbi:hypothetical protein [uncultured Streptomyces sp.]|uniref:hypothetical protein n=1 Tax=uncultured Streptomyces sp. TaxID=174707 RepID=UPI0026088B57|nr:hypothetical protein [uncultured Streptomyces sp.]